MTEVPDVSPVASGEEAPFRTRSDKGVVVDVLFGVMFPLFCLAADPTSVLKDYLGEYRHWGLSFLLAEIVLLIAWLLVRKKLGKQNFVFGLLLIPGGIAALFVGVVMLPLTAMGLFILIGILGLVPFGTAFVFFRAGLRALRAGGLSSLAAGVLVGVPVAAAPVAAYAAFHAVHRPPNLALIVRTGDPYVDAVYEFRNDRGLWPQYAEDLVPDYLPTVPQHGWEYGPGPTLSRWVAWKDTPFDKNVMVCYEFRDGHEGWSVSGRETYQKLDVEEIGNPRSRPEANVPAETITRELRRRIDREPRELDHYKDLVSHHVGGERWKESVAAALEARDALPNEWWPRLALADLERRSSGDTRYEEELITWVDHSPRFTHLWYLAEHFRRKGDRERTLQTVERAVTYPLITFRNDPKTDHYFAFSLAVYAYDEGADELAVAICDRAWDEWADGEYLAIRAAARLRLGEREEAIADAEEALKESERRAMWAKNLDALLDAAKRGDREFAYRVRMKMEIELYHPPK